jgi:hypothetical protein
MPFPKLPNGMISGRLRPSEKQRIVDVLAQKGAGSSTCELCGTRKWLIGDYLVSPEGLARHSVNNVMTAPGDPSHPSFLMLCSNCGNSKMLNAHLLGAFDLFDETAPDE